MILYYHMINESFVFSFSVIYWVIKTSLKRNKAISVVFIHRLTQCTITTF